MFAAAAPATEWKRGRQTGRSAKRYKMRMHQAEADRDHRGITDVLELAMRLAETPCSAIKGNCPARLLRELATGAQH